METKIREIREVVGFIVIRLAMAIATILIIKELGPDFITCMMI